MKAKDIVVGREYAVGRPLGTFPDRAVVLEVGNPERTVRVPAGRGFARHQSTAPGARVRVLHRDGSEMVMPTGYIGNWSNERVVPLSHVIRPWEDQVDYEDRKRAAEAAAAARDAELRERAEVLRAVLAARCISANAWVRGNTVEVTFYGVDKVNDMIRFLEDPLGMEESGVKLAPPAPAVDPTGVIDQALKRMRDSGSLDTAIVPLAWSQTIAKALQEAGVLR